MGLSHHLCIREKLLEKRELKINGAFVNTFLLLVDVKNLDVLTSLNALGGMTGELNPHLTPLPFCGRGGGGEEAGLSSIHNLRGFK